MSNLSVRCTDILLEAQVRAKLARERVEKLSEMGITNDWLDQFEQEIEDALQIVSHRARQLAMKQATRERDQVVTACFKWGQKLRYRIKSRYDSTSVPRSTFPSDDLTAAAGSANEMLRLMAILIKIATDHADDLRSAGQTREVLLQGASLRDQLEEAFKNQVRQRHRTRDISHTRQEAFGNLYDKVNQINRAGRIVYHDDPIRLTLFRSPWKKYRKSTASEAQDSDRTDQETSHSNDTAEQASNAGENLPETSASDESAQES